MDDLFGIRMFPPHVLRFHVNHTRSVALVTTSFLLLLVRHFVTRSVALVSTSFKSKYVQMIPVVASSMRHPLGRRGFTSLRLDEDVRPQVAQCRGTAW